tara:strand:- start:8912 stop:14803 length:5892 start_codon:yes stop_codon:yes gene_type:complete
MPLARLDNFLKNVRGNILYVSPNDLDSTDAIENQGNSMARPFKTIQRALVEAARFSYQKGLDNDRFGKTTILLMPGDHLIDNRPGFIPLTGSNFLTRSGLETSDFSTFDSTTNFDIESPDNALYKLNSVHGGVVIPRGTSLVGYDLRKTKVRPLYVPDPENSAIDRTAVFRVTGGCYFWQMTFFDGRPNGLVYKNYTPSQFVPNFSHHKVTCFEYADGVNNVYLNDSFNINRQFDRTDLEMYYEKVGLAYGPASGRTIEPNFPNSGLDIQPKIDEYRIVGPKAGSVGISTIFAGDGGSNPSETITVQLGAGAGNVQGIDGLQVDTMFQVNDCADSRYNGQFVVDSISKVDSVTGRVLEFTYQVPDIPLDALENPPSASISLDTDTVKSASPYIFNISLRSVYGMCGMHADGSKASGFKSMVVAQFTGVSLQKDDQAFIKYNNGTFTRGTPNLHSDGEAKYHPDYYSFHIKASNDAVIQIVSVFAIGYAQQFITESGGDFSVTNSNSNFGEIALNSVSYRDQAFEKDDVGYITHIIPPQEITSNDFNLEYDAIDVTKTLSVAAGAATTSKLFLAEQTNADAAPRTLVQGYRIGSAANDNISVGISSDNTGVKEYAARIVMPNSTTSSKKEFEIGRVGTANSISSDIITLTSNHTLVNGETIRFISDDARLPDGLDNNKVYFAITDGLNADQLKVAASFSESSALQQITLNNLGGTIRVQSRVSDKIVGDLGHPIQYDTTNEQWFINVEESNALYSAIKGIGSGIVGDSTSRTFITRKADSRPLGDKLYKFRYVIPAGAGISSARQPLTSYILEESNTIIGSTNAEVALQYSPSSQTMGNQSEMRNFRFIKSAVTDGTFNYFTSEVPHGLTLGSEVRINQVTSTVNTTGIANSGYNQKYTVVSVPKSDLFVVQAGVANPGTFTNNTSQRNTSLPNFNRVKAPNNYFIYDIDTIKEYTTGVQDGVYYLTIVDSTNTPKIAPYTDRNKFAFPQPIKDLFPQYDRDNPNSNPDAAIAYASSKVLGNVEIDDPKHSLTRFVASQGQVDLAVGFGITNIVSNSAGTAHTIFTKTEHGLNRITKLSIDGSGGAGYGNNTGSNESLYNASLIDLGGSSKGVDASARITVNATGQITDIELMNPGTNYSPGDTLTVTGVSTFSPYTAATVTVDNILNNVGNTVRIENIASFARKEYNKLYEITGITTQKQIEVTSIGGTITNPSFTGIGATVTNLSFGTLTGTSLSFDNSKFVYDNTVGIATITTTTNHGFRANNQITIDGSAESLYNGEFIVKQIVGLTTFTVDIGKSATSPTISGTVKAYTPGLIPQPGIINLFDENFGGRVLNVYDNLTAQLSSQVATLSIDEINIANLATLDFKIGDYVRIDDEIMRIKTTVTSNPVKVFRGLMGTKTSTHISGSVVKRVLVEPIELRRPSIIRASGHTFEYCGFGPGNYSTALPEKQTSQLTTKQQLAAQSFNSAGGITVFTGMNDRGDFFVGNKKISSNTGKEEVFDTPIPTVTGEDIFSVGTDTGIDIINPAEITVSRSVKVEGGNTGSLLSQFDGPVLFNKKITSTSSEGIEANHVFIQGDATVSRKYSVGIATPTNSATAGDVVWKAQPEEGGHHGWVYTTDNEWYPFGNISIDRTNQIYIFDSVGVATTSPGTNTFQVGSGTSLVAIDGNGGVGIGTTANGFDIRTNGNGIYVGNAGTFYGDGSGLTNLANDSLFQGVAAGLGTGIFPQSGLTVGIDTTEFDSEYSLLLGSPGTGKTNLYVNNQSRFISTAAFDGNVNIDGKLSVTSFDIASASSNMTVGVLTATELCIGAGCTILKATANGIGINEVNPVAALDVREQALIQSTYELPNNVTSSSNTITLEVNKNNAFLHVTTENVNKFVLSGLPANAAASFTIRIIQNATSAKTIAIDTFETIGGTSIPVYWPGGVVPTVTNAINAADIYSYITFDGGASLYGVVGGQNFS